MTFEVTVLGCGAATPTSRFSPSAQVVNVHDKLFLVDCGEGTQMQLRRFKIKFQRIQHIFISHLHGDHYLGLVGLISSLHLLGRSAELHIYGPADLRELVEVNLRLSQTWLEYPIHFHAVGHEESALIFEDRTLEVWSIPLKHRIECTGYIFREKPRERKMRKEKQKEYRILPSEILLLKRGEDVVRENGEVLTPDMTCEPPVAPRSYAYCSDTRYWERVGEMVQGVDLLYHESTFLESERERAKTTFHSTAKDAARIARDAGVGKLLLGHFSSRYSEVDRFVEEAQEFFAEVTTAEEGKVYPVGAVVDQMIST